MKIRILRALRGPNYFHNNPVIYMMLDIGKLEYCPSDKVPNFKEKIEKILPSLYNHKCSIGEKGGFFERLIRGTWAGHIVEHVAIELQNLVGYEVRYGKTITLNEKGVYNLAFRYKNEKVGLRAGQMAVEIVESIFDGIDVDINTYLNELKELSKETEFGPSTQSIVNEAIKRNIPYTRLNQHSFVQFGRGINQRRIQATMTDQTSALGVEIAADKNRSKEILEKAGIPTPKGFKAQTIEKIKEYADKLGYPLVVKPLVGNHGRGVTSNIEDETQLEAAFILANKISNTVIVEKHLTGNDYRFLLVDKKLVAVAKREPAYVIGDGEKTISELIDQENLTEKRGEGHENMLTKISIDTDTLDVLAKQNLSIQSVLEKGQKVYLKSTSNISSGGTAEDVTDLVHPSNVKMAERIAKLVGLDIMGIDIIAKSVESPMTNENSGVIEVNAGPGFRMHLEPSSGKGRDIGKYVMDMLYPEGKEYNIPICAVTGTNGKTTTTRLIAHIITQMGKVVGLSSTDKVTVDGQLVAKGDYSGPGGASLAMQDPSVEYGVFEVARGGIIRRGMAFDKADVGVFLNVSNDHLGIDGIDDLDDLTRVKSTVVESVKENGVAVLNADDENVLSRVDRIKASKSFFSLDPENAHLSENLEDGGFNVTLDADNNIIIQTKTENIFVENVKNIPITFDGKATFNIKNALAAVAATYGLGVDLDTIRKGLNTFESDQNHSPGRMNFFDIDGLKVVVDYGHNPDAIKSTGKFLCEYTDGRKLRMAAGVGDRRTEDLLEFGEIIAKYSDYVIISDPSARTREVGATAGLVRQGIINGGFDPEMIDIEIDEDKAIARLLEMGRPGDLVILQVENIAKSIDHVLRFKKEKEQNK